MTTAQWALVIGSVFGPGGLLLALAAWLHSLATARASQTAQQTALQLATSAHSRIDHLQHGWPPHSAP